VSRGSSGHKVTGEYVWRYVRID